MKHKELVEINTRLSEVYCVTCGNSRTLLKAKADRLLQVDMIRLISTVETYIKKYGELTKES